MTQEEAINKLHGLIYGVVDRQRIDDTCREVIDYLNEQEPVEPKTVQDVNGVYAACGKCDHKLWKMFGAEFTVSPSKMPRFCSSCGRAVKWE